MLAGTGGAWTPSAIWETETNSGPDLSGRTMQLSRLFFRPIYCVATHCLTTHWSLSCSVPS
jgi:hypothetical protein